MIKLKTILIIFVLILSMQTAYSQACGIYRIKYVGKIESESFKIKKIKLPSIKFLHNLEKEFSEKSFIEVKLNGNKINEETASYLTSHLYESPKILANFYKSKREAIPLIFVINENEKEIVKYLSWDDIEIKLIEDDVFGNLFELNLKNIKL